LEAEESTHSAVVLLTPMQGEQAGAWLRLASDVSHELVERGLAAWARDKPIPPDTRPPVDVAPADDWPELRFTQPVRLTTRHLRDAGDVARVAPDEAATLVRAGVAEAYVPPPPPPPPSVFE
jgi:hypothetical protein